MSLLCERGRVPSLAGACRAAPSSTTGSPEPVALTARDEFPRDRQSLQRHAPETGGDRRMRRTDRADVHPDPAMTRDRAALTRAAYAAYETGDRAAMETLADDDLRFWSPVDEGIDRAAYFARCWPNHEHLAAFRIVRLVPHGEDEVVVTYEAERTDGGRFRNTEVLTFAGDRLRTVEVYFGWSL
jgi:hypothetical protein